MYTEILTTPCGQQFKATFSPDEFMAEPWREHDGHGSVTGWTRDAKRSYEMLLNDDRGSKRYYNFKAAVKLAKLEGWNTKPYTFKTAGEQAHAAAMADFKHLKAWCNDDWWWSFVEVVLLDSEGEELTAYSESLGGVEDGHGNCRIYAIQCAQELAGELVARRNSDNEAAQVVALHCIKDNALFCAGVI